MTSAEAHLKALAAKLYKFQQENILCDTVLIADDCQIWAHSIVLAATSPFIYTHFLMIAGQKAKYRFSVELAGCDSVCIRAVLHFLYTGSLVLPKCFQQPQTFTGILLVCEKLGINVTELDGASVKFVDSNPYISPMMESCSDLPDKSIHESSGELLDNESLSAAVFEHLTSPCIKEVRIKEEESFQVFDDADIKLEMDVYEPSSPNSDVRNFIQDGEKEIATRVVMIPSVVDDSSANGSDGAVIKLNNSKLTDIWQTASVRAATKILKNTFKKRNRRINGHRHLKNRNATELQMFPQSDASLTEGMKCERENIICQICGKTFQWYSDLKKHMKMYESHSSLTCKVCGKVMTSKRQLSRHEKLHASHKLYPCLICGRVYRYRSGLALHSYEHTGQLPYLCDVCGAGFKDFFSMGQHKKRRHSTFRQFVCKECGKGFIRNVLLLRHMKVHTGEKQHVCPTCGMTFGYSANLNRHILSHVGEKSHICGVCGKGFIRLDHLQGHALIHKGEQHHQCTDCKKVFKSAILLKRHTIIHSDENMYTCNICSKRFTASIRLKQHMVMHQEKQHKCHICAKTFSFERFLVGHINRCHRETGKMADN